MVDSIADLSPTVYANSICHKACACFSLQRKSFVSALLANSLFV